MPKLRVDYPIETAILRNGLTVQINPDPNAPAVGVNLWYRIGSGDETTGATGFAHLFEHLMFQGSANVDSGEHLGALEAVGAQANATTSFDRTNYFETVPPQALELALWLEADRMASLNVNQENLDTQREVVKEEKRQRYDNVPYGDHLQLLLDLNFPATHPYGHPTIGSMADLDAATLTDVQDFHSRWYRPDGAILSLSGALSVSCGLELAEQYFGAIPPGPQPVPPASHPPALPPHTQVPATKVHRQVPRGCLTLSWRTAQLSGADHIALMLGLEVLAGSQSSRLHHRLVRQTELAESVLGGDYELARGTSLAVLSARARDGVELDRVREEILPHLGELATDGPSAAELSRVKASFEREWLSELAMTDARADAMGRFATLFGDPQRINTFLDEVQAVDEADVGAAVKRWLQPQNRAELHYLSEQAVSKPSDPSSPQTANAPRSRTGSGHTQ